MLHACATRFDVTGNLQKSFLVFFGSEVNKASHLGRADVVLMRVSCSMSNGRGSVGLPALGSELMTCTQQTAHRNSPGSIGPSATQLVPVSHPRSRDGRRRSCSRVASRPKSESTKFQKQKKKKKVGIHKGPGAGLGPAPVKMQCPCRAVPVLCCVLPPNFYILLHKINQRPLAVSRLRLGLPPREPRFFLLARTPPSTSTCTATDSEQTWRSNTTR